MLTLLLKNKLNIIFLGFTRDTPKRKTRRIIGSFIGIVVFSLIIFYSIKLISFIYNRLDLELANLILDIALDYAFAIMFIFIVFTGIATTLYILYLSRDLELLLSLPIGHRTVFTYKFIEALISNSYLFFIVIFPFLIAYGATSKMPIAYYPIMVIVFISVLSIPTSMGVLLGMIAARYINPKRAREILAVIGGFLGLIIWFSSQILPRYMKNLTPEFKSMESENIKQYISATFSKPFLKVLPSTWGSNALISFHNGSYGSFGLNFILITAASALLIFLCITLSQKLYYSGWSSASQVISRKKEGKEKIESQVGTGGKIYTAKIITRVNYLLIKDFKILFRDFRRIIQVFMPLIMFIFIFFWSISKDINGTEDINFFVSISTLFFLFFPLFVTGVVNLNISGNNIGGEGLSFWILKVSPVSSKKLLKIKIIFSSIISVLSGIIMMIIFYIVFKPSQSSKGNISFLGGLLIFIFFIVYLLFFGGIVIGGLFAGSFLLWSNLIIFPMILVFELIVNLILYKILINISAYRLNRLSWEY